LEEEHDRQQRWYDIMLLAPEVVEGGNGEERSIASDPKKLELYHLFCYHLILQLSFLVIWRELPAQYLHTIDSQIGSNYCTSLAG
jgi:hypothetical protein